MKKSYIPLLCAMLLIGGMVGAADLFGNSEIIFPEIAAIATGALLTPRLAWRTDALHTFGAIVICAALGLGIVLWMPGAVWLQMSIAYLMASVLFLLSRTSADALGGSPACVVADQVCCLPDRRLHADRRDSVCPPDSGQMRDIAGSSI